MKLVFMGTPEFAVPTLKKLIDTFGVQCVFTQPDKPKGRGKKLGISAVKEAAMEYDIEILQPGKIRKDTESIEKLKSINPDFIIVVAFGQLLSKEILDIPKYGCINLHASLLPKYRGAAPINWAIIKGEKKSGSTTMLMNEGLDTGDILLQDEVDITDGMNAGELHDILMNRGGDLVVRTINGIVDGSIKPRKQPDETLFYASMLDKKMAKVEWNLTSLQICNLVRGLNPWPVAYTLYNNNMMKIYDATPINEENQNVVSGSILDISENGIKVKTGDGAVIIKIIQFPGKRPLHVSEYIRGNKLEKGTILI